MTMWILRDLPVCPVPTVLLEDGGALLPAGEKDFLPKVRLCPIHCRNFRAPAVLPAAPPTQLLLRGATQRLVPARRDPQNPVTIPSAVSHPVLPGNAPPGGHAH